MAIVWTDFVIASGEVPNVWGEMAIARPEEPIVWPEMVIVWPDESIVWPEMVIAKGGDCFALLAMVVVWNEMCFAFIAMDFISISYKPGKGKCNFDRGNLKSGGERANVFIHEKTCIFLRLILLVWHYAWCAPMPWL